jgi:hypothetical protein
MTPEYKITKLCALCSSCDDEAKFVDLIKIWPKSGKMEALQKNQGGVDIAGV